MRTKKDLNYYLNLPYKIEITAIKEKDGGGYIAALPQIGRFALCADGETIEEALRNLEEIKKERFAFYLENNIQIPEPTEDEEEYSGKFVIRIPRMLHKHLAYQARLNGVSLNQYVTYLLAMNLGKDKQGVESGNTLFNVKSGDGVTRSPISTDDYEKAA